MSDSNLILNTNLIQKSESGANHILNLNRFLYLGGASHKADKAINLIKNGELGEPQSNRIPLLSEIHSELDSRLVMGKSVHSVITCLHNIRKFINFCEQQSLSFQTKDLINNYWLYAEFLFISAKSSESEFKENSAYTQASVLSALLGNILNIPPALRLIRRTRLTFTPASKKAVPKKAEKQNLENTFIFGHFIIDLIKGLTPANILGHMPLTISIRPGIEKNKTIVINTGLIEVNFPSTSISEWSDYDVYRYSTYTSRRKPVNSIEDLWNANRWILVNLRVQAEFLLFIAQTGMNSTQAKKIKIGTLKFKPLGDSWQVRSYKNRKGGEVTFTIFKDYKPFLQSYISFVNHFFPDSELLFPLYNKNGLSVTRTSLDTFPALKNLITAQNIVWIPPSQLRLTRLNWLLRRSGDSEITAEMHQHSVATLEKRYEQPSQQRAMIEVTQFWNNHDIIKKNEKTDSLLGSTCNGKPESIIAKPMAVVEPDCVTPSGCLWCKHHRDSDSFEYVWSLVSMKHLKSLEASLVIDKTITPSDRVINRLVEKIEWFKNSSVARADWVKEADLRIAEGYYHSAWNYVIELLEQ